MYYVSNSHEPIISREQYELVQNALNRRKREKSDYKLLNEQGISTGAMDMYCVKPLDKEGLLKAAKGKKLIVTVEEHAPFGGLGSMVAQVISTNDPKKVINLALPDSPVITGTSQEVFDYYGLNAAGIVNTVKKALEG